MLDNWKKRKNKWRQKQDPTDTRHKKAVTDVYEY